MGRNLRSFAGSLVLLALTGISEAGAQAVGVTLTWLYPAESVFLTDFDPFSPGNQPDLFALNIVGGSGQNVVLELSATMTHPDQIEIFRATTNPFALPLNRTLTNRDLATRDQPWSVRDFELSAESDQLTETLRQTSRFPEGRYLFTVQVRTAGTFGTILGEASVVRELANPTRIELLGPGVPFGSVPPIITTTAPRFLWSADAPIANLGSDHRPYRIRVSRVSDAATGDEAMSGFAVWDEQTGATSVVYPESATAIALLPGTTYAWQVVREIRTSGGTEHIESPIYWFRMASASGSPGGGGGGTPPGADESVNQQMQQLADLFGLGGMLDGFEPQGTIFVDGVPVPIEAFLELLRRMISGDASVNSITVR